MAVATATEKPKRKTTVRNTAPKPVYLLHRIVDAEGNDIQGAKLADVSIVKNGDDAVDAIEAAQNAGTPVPKFIRFVVPKTSRAKTDA